MTASASSMDAPKIDGSNVDLRLVGLTTVVVLVATVAINRLIAAFGLDNAKELAGAPLAGSTFIYSAIRARITGNGGLTPAGVVSIKGYEIGWATLAILAALTIVGVGNLASFLLTFLTGSIEAGLGGGIGVMLATAVAAGRLIGIRADGHAVLAAAIAGVLAQLIGNVVTFLLVDEAFRSQLGIAMTTEYLQSFGLACLLFGGACVAGALIGARNREGGYLGYLLKRIDPGTRNSVIQMVFEESRGRR